MNRSGRHIAAMLVATAVLLAGWSGQANASEREWCEDDPLFVVNGNQFTLTTGFAAANLSSVSSIAYVLEVPSDARVSVASPGQQAALETVTISRSLPASGGGAYTVVAHVSVNASGQKFAFVTTVGGPTQSGTYYGTSNKTTDITLSFPN